MTAGEESDEDLFDHRLLSDDSLPNLRAQPSGGGEQVFAREGVRFCRYGLERHYHPRA
jgi:hypothetical protein